ncbi:MAG: hypothetical protein RLY70_4117 [Planctomycetota bacterium]
MIRHRLPALVAGVWCLWLAADAMAGSPRLNRLSPPGGQRGTTVEVHFIGKYLEQPEEVLLYEPGMVAESIEVVEGEIESNGRKERVEAGTRVRVRLKVADNCVLGGHGIRLRTANGLSDYQRFFVGPFPTVLEDEQPRTPNDKPETAKPVSLNSTILGMVSNTDVDLFRVEAKKGDRLTAEIEAARLGVERGLPDLHLSLLDEQGKTLVAADDSALFAQDPIVSRIADRDGVYFVAVRHCVYNATNEQYRLHVGTFSRPTAVYPAGGQPGEELSVRIIGDPRGEWTQTVRLPSDGATLFPFSAEDSGVPAPTPNLIRVSPLPNRLEREPNDSPESLAGDASSVASTLPGSVEIALPAALNGILSQPGDVDLFRIRGKKGERFRVHALANALGSPLDPTITITPVDRKTGGAPVRATDSRPNQLGMPPVGGLNRDTLDPVLDFTVPADGEYLVKIEDDRGNGGPDFVYRVEIQPETDAVLTYIPLEPENQFTPQARQVINVAAGNRYNTSVSIFNTNRPFAGELELVAIGLPEGVTMRAPRITGSMPRVPVVFEAAPGTRTQGKLIDIVVRPVPEAGAADANSTGSPPVLPSGFRQVIAMNQYGNNDFYLHTVLDRLPIAVTQPVPFRLEVESPKSALVQNGEMTLKFRVVRESGFDGPVTVSMEWRPSGVTGATPITIRAGQSEGEYLLSAARNAVAGPNQVTLTAVSGGERPGYYDNSNRAYVASEPFKLTVAEPHVDARFARSSIERGKTAPLTVKLNPLRPFAGTAKATLARLPRGVQLVEPFQEITAESKEVTFTLRATEECLVGSYQGLTLDLSVIEDGQTVRQLCGSGTLRVDAERGVARAN